MSLNKYMLITSLSHKQPSNFQAEGVERIGQEEVSRGHRALAAGWGSQAGNC